MLDRGKTVFAETCARCHSSKAPKPRGRARSRRLRRPRLPECWNSYWAWTKTDDYKQQMRAIVSAPDFLDGNYLSTESRVPVTLLQTNACSPLATNALAGNIWDNFSSQSYKTLPSVGTITVHDPFTGEPRAVQDAGRRARLHAAAVADQPVVDGAVPAQQQRRARSSRIPRSMPGCGSSRPRSSRCCGRRSASRIGARRQGAGRDRPHRRRAATSAFPAAFVPDDPARPEGAGA